jgi:hypothetical protein
MKLYLAGCETGHFEDIAYNEGVKNFLYSYFYLKNDARQLRELKEKNPNINIFVDSGGYSARKKGVEIDIYSWLFFIRKNKDILTVAVNLDVMDLEQSQANQKLLEEEFPVLPVYHFVEYMQGREDIFIEMCNKYKYIALGGVAGEECDKKSLTNFFRFCFKIALEKKVKIHGLGITRENLLMEYPFYSCDSTSWLSGGIYGRIVKWNEQKYKMNTLHYGEREKMLEHNPDVKTIEDYKERLKHNALEYLKMEKSITDLWLKRGIDFSTW